MHFMNNPSSQNNTSKQKHSSIPLMNKHNHSLKIENNDENILLL